MNRTGRLAAQAILVLALAGCGKAKDVPQVQTEVPQMQTDETQAQMDEARTDETQAQTDETQAGETAAAAENAGLPAKPLPDSQALDFTASLGAGINWGNTFDAYMDQGLAADLSDELRTETCWQHVGTTQEAIQGLADAGFSTIRIPVSWHNHIADDALTISPVFMDRVNTVVDWALDAGLHVILNIHHDNHEEANGFYPDPVHAAQSRKYISGIWRQLAERYKDYDERLIFESMNEPRLVGHENEWWFDVSNPPADVRDAIACINELNQIFVDTVRSVEGAHRDCYLMCPGYDASVDGALVAGFALPTDAEGMENRLIVSVHAYTPYHFALEDNGADTFDPAQTADTREIDAFMDRLYDRYIKEGTPVVIGEFGARDRNGNLAARKAFTDYYTESAWSRGMPCFWWDNGAFSGGGEVFGIYDRAACEWKYPEIRDALLAHVGR